LSNPDTLKQIDATMESLMRRIDELDHEGFDADAADGKIVLECENGDHLILSRQSATAQIWLAEPSGGWHFDWDGTHWMCDKRGIELLQTLEDLLAARIGETIDLR
jgi:CyaY protein